MTTFGLVAALVILGMAAAVHGQTNFSWNTPVHGYVNDSARWTPTGIPGLLDHMHYNPTGAYTVTYNSGVPHSALTVVGGGPVTFNLASPHTTDELLIGSVPGPPP